MGPSEFLSVLRARWWAVVLVALVGAGVAWITAPAHDDNVAEPVLYRATTVLVRGQSATGVPTDGTNLTLAASLATSDVVIQRSAKELGRTPSDLTDGLTASVTDRLGTLVLSTVDLDRAGAAAEADTIAAQLITYVAERRQQQLEPLITATTERIAAFDTRLRELEAQVVPPGAQADLQRAERESVIRQLTTNYDRLQQLTTQSSGAATELEVLSAAAVIPEPGADKFAIPDSPAARAAIAVVIATLVALALLFVTERINPRVRTVAQAERAFGLPVIAEIPRETRRFGARRSIATFSEPYSIAAESYRGLRTALWYIPRANGPHPEMHDRFTGGHVVLVTSASPSDGKTTVVANLAAAFAEKDGDVVVVSGDARQPEIEPLLLGRRATGARLAANEQTDTVLTMIPGVKLALSCDPDSNPADIVGHETAVARRERTRSQIVIIDTPPVLVANDASELMHTADSVVVVARAGSTTVAAAARAGELITRLRAPVVGVVLVGTSDASADARYYRRRPSKRSSRGSRRVIAPSLSSLTHDRDTTAAEPAAPSVPVAAGAPAPTPSADDGGIWRRAHAMIDLNAAGDQLPARAPLPEVAPRPPRTTVGEGYPSRDMFDADGPVAPAEVDDAVASGRPRLPLFRAHGADDRGNGRSR